MAGNFQRFCETYGYQYLNAVQKEAIQCVNGAGLLFSVPGSGKTTVIVARAGYMVHECGINPENILIITFTRAAAEEMRQRYRKKFPDSMGVPDFRTIHSFCYRMIREMGMAVGANVPGILDSSYHLVECLLRDHHFFPEKEVVDSVTSKITEAKNRMFGADAISKVEIEGLPEDVSFEMIFREYRERLRAGNLMDQDDLLVYANGLMRKYPMLLEQMQRRYPYVSVDEAQDTSVLQHRIIEAFCSAYGNIFMVGDDDQSIYGFRGADPEEMLRFGERWPNAKMLTMNINYRSDRKIVSKADAFISRNKYRTEKKMTAQSAAEGTVLYPAAKNYSDQIRCLVGEALKAKEAGESLAILYRQNVSGFALQYALAKEGIRCPVLPGGNPVTAEKTVRDTLRLLEFAFHRTDPEKFSNCYSMLGLYLNRNVISEARQLHTRYPDKDILQALAETRTEREADQMAACNRRLRQLTEMNTLCALETIERDFMRNTGKNTRVKIACEFLKYVARDYEQPEEYIGAVRTLDETVCDKAEQVVLSTLHSCKGLEFDRVIMIDLTEDMIPGKSDIEKRLKECTTAAEKKQLRDEEERRIEEETRLFYVGATRARHELQMLIRKEKDAEISSLLKAYRGKDTPVSTHAPSGSKARVPGSGTAQPAAPMKKNIGNYLKMLYPFGVPDNKK